MSALIIGASRTRIALSLARGLAVKGIKSYTADSLNFTRCGFSKYSSGNFTYISPLVSRERFVNDIHRIMNETGAKVIFPAHDELYYFLIEHDDFFKEIPFIPVPSFEQIKKIKSKDSLIKISQKMKVLIPETLIVNSLEDLQVKVAEWGFPVVVKPVDESSGRGIYCFRNKVDFENKSNLLEIKLKENKLLLQKYIDGTSYGIGLIYNNGKSVCSVSYKHVHQYPVFGGSPTLTENIYCPKLINILEGVLDKLNWNGICQADFLVEKSTGIPYLIDINPRLFGALSQSICQSINFPYILYKISFNNNIKEENRSLDEGRKILWLEGEIARVFDCLKNNEYRSVFRGLADINEIEDFMMKDFKPFFFSPLCFFYKYYRKVTGNYQRY